MNVRTSLAVLAVALIFIVFVVFVMPSITGGGPRTPTPSVVRIQALVAQNDLLPGIPVEKADLFSTEAITVAVAEQKQYYTVPADTLVDEAHPLVVTRYIRRGEPIKVRDVQYPEKMRGVPDWDLEVISFPAEFDKVIGGQLWPGQRINIYLYGRPVVIRGEEVGGPEEQQFPQVELVAHHVWVVDVRTASGSDTGYRNVVSPNQTPIPKQTPATPPVTSPASIITVAVPHSVARRLVELMGSMNFRAWISLSPKEETIVTPTPLPTRPPARTATPTITLTPTAAPTATRPPTPTNTPPTPPPTGIPTSTPTRVPTIVPPPTPTRGPGTPPPAVSCLYQLKAVEPYLIGGYGDNMDYDGSDTHPRHYGGLADIYVDVCKDIKDLQEWRIRATLDVVKDEELPLRPAKDVSLRGNIEVMFTSIEGLKYQLIDMAGNIVDPKIAFSGDPILGVPYLPESQIILAAWGKGQIKTGQRILYDNLRAFMMFTPQGSRDDQTRRVLKRDGSCCYNPSNPKDGYIKEGDKELHLWFYSEEEDANNLPKKKIFVNLIFENVDILLPKTGQDLLPNTGESR